MKRHPLRRLLNTSKKLKRIDACMVNIKQVNEKPERNAEVIKSCQTGKFTLSQLAVMYGISRERIRQIYKKGTGASYRVRILNYREKRKEEEVQQLAQFAITPIRKCAAVGCAKGVYAKKGKTKRAYCEDHFAISKDRNLRIRLSCYVCGMFFFPFRNYNSPSLRHRRKSIYCSPRCYGINMRKSGLRKESGRDK